MQMSAHYRLQLLVYSKFISQPLLVGVGRNALIVGNIVTPRQRLYSTTSSALDKNHSMEKSKIRCDVNAEPLYRYRRGGYHPIHLGTYLQDGRYKILHKLGFGGWSTVWAARDKTFADLCMMREIILNSKQSSALCRNQDCRGRIARADPRAPSHARSGSKGLE